MVRDSDPKLLTFFIKPDCNHPDYKSEGDSHAIFMVNTDTMDSERVCSVPVGFHKTVVAEMCPFFRDTRRWWDNYFIFEHIPNCCFDPCYEADLAAMLSPDITNEDMSRVSDICYSIAIKNPLYPLWSLSNMKDASVREQKYDDARRQCLSLGIPEWFIEWPEKRPNIATFKFPWELVMIEFNYVCKKTGESRQGVVWDNGYVGTDSGDRYTSPKDFAKAAAKEGTIKMGWWMTRKSSDTLWAILELQPMAVDGKVTSPRMKIITHRYGKYLVFVGEDDRGVAFWDPGVDEAPWIADFDGDDYEGTREMLNEDWCRRVVERCMDLAKLAFP